MTSVHSRLTLPMMLAPGRQPREMRRAITIEIHRLNDREDELLGLQAIASSWFAVDLATDQLDRIAQRRDALLLRIHPKKWR